MGFFDKFNEATSSHNYMSPFGEAGLLGDPLHYLGGDKYDNFMRKTWETPNKEIGPYVAKFNKFDRKINPMHKAIDKTEFGQSARDMVENKPGDSALAILGSIFGGGALMGSFGGGAGGGASGSGQGLGIFGSGGQGGMAGVGQGNAGQLFANTGINTGGVGGVGGTGAGSGFGQLGMQDWMKIGQGMPGQQQQQEQQPQGPQPYWYQGRVIWM